MVLVKWVGLCATTSLISCRGTLSLLMISSGGAASRLCSAEMPGRSIPVYGEPPKLAR
jgi:hypothetical protein